MKRFLILPIIIFATSLSQAHQNDSSKYYELSQPSVEFLGAEENFIEAREANSLSNCLNNEDREDFRSEFDFNQLINIGEKIWQIVKAGEPELNFKSKSATAIPAQAQCLFYLSGWSIPQSRTYRVTYKNGFGMEVISMTYKLIYSFGGQFENNGRYLANVSIHPSQISVSWGFSFDAHVHVQDILNIGSSESPEAGMQVALEWSVGSVVNKHKSQEVYFIQGSGPLTAL